MIDGTLSWGEEDLEGDDRGEKFHRFSQWSSSIILNNRIGIVAYEEVRFNRGFSYIPGQMAMIQSYCTAHDLAYVGVNVSELKKWATGMGNVGKEEMVQAAMVKTMQFMGSEPFLVTDNEADALLTMFWTLENVIH